jgi:beta-lactam-binding protein with PASTA domain
VIGAIASSVPNSTTVPDVVGRYPQEAIAAINAAGLTTNSHGGIGDDEGQGFVVCETVPVAGARLDPDVAEVEIFSRRDCEPKSPLAKAHLRRWQAARHNS